MKNSNITFVFFGTSVFATSVLDALLSEKLKPSLIITAPDKPAGRGMQLTASPVKVWAQKNNIAILQPEKLDSTVVSNLQPTTYNLQKWDVFVVAAYGHIIPSAILGIPKHGTLNVHPSLLPHHRGPSPIEAQIIADDSSDVGVSIMLLDEKMDHGPILGQTAVSPENWPLTKTELEDILAHEGGVLLAYLLPQWVQGKVTPQEQEHTQATYTPMIRKKDAELDLEDVPPRLTFLKIKAYDKNPRAYFITHNQKRVLVTDASFKNNKLVIKKVIPEGKKEILYKMFLTSQR